MPTTIDPPLGEAPLFVAGGVATTTGYSAIDLRLALGVALQEGAVEALAYKVMERLSGAAMFVEIDADAGSCVVQGDYVTGQGLYPVPPHSANIVEEIAAADVTNPRIDQVVLEVLDNVHDASGGNLARVRVIAGTPTGGATLDNRTGAAALPSSCMRLADVLVGAGVTSIVTANIRDRRTWARGASKTISRTANASATNDYTSTSSTPAAIDATNLSPRIECSGTPVKIALRGLFAALTNPGTVSLRVDGALVDGGPRFDIPTDANNSPAFEWVTTPAAGTHVIAPFYHIQTSGTITAFARSDIPLLLTVEEVVRQNASND